MEVLDQELIDLAERLTHTAFEELVLPNFQEQPAWQVGKYVADLFLAVVKGMSVMVEDKGRGK